MKLEVIKSYDRPYEDPIAVAARERVMPDFTKETEIEGWVWCTAKDGRCGWTPRGWLILSDGAWRVNREFNAIELTVVPGEVLDAVLEESGFFWATKRNGDAGWVPSENVAVVQES